MPKYTITSKAGRNVAGQRNGGVGTELDLTEEQAAAALERGELHLPGSAPEPEAEAETKTAKTKTAKKAEGGTDA